MFDGARAALLSTCMLQADEIGRTHSGLISAFGLHLVKTGKVPVNTGRMLKRAEEFRLIADYKGDEVEPSDALMMVEQAEAFVAEIRSRFLD